MSAARRRVVLSWSGGKDSALALAALRADPGIEIVALATTLTADHDRISMHGVRRELVEAQADRLGLPLWPALIPAKASNAAYEAAMGALFDRARAEGVEAIAFGDLFLADIRAYRDRLVTRHGLGALYPVWERDTEAVYARFLRLGFKAVIVCVDPARLDPAFLGRTLDGALRADLPATVDPCGENGEFHSFVHDGPGFARPVGIRLGDVVCRDGFWFRDLTLES
ncbi:MAG: adenine nucleotide alpha hydrolase [Alphaproteobacteria bacterium]|nr:adenine nucleotide alpha hydrolase [Alphaproteobacteria bacterium]